AKGGDLSRLRDKTREHRERHSSPDELRKLQEARRFFRHFVDGIGMVNIAAALTPEVGHSLLTRLDAATNRLRREKKARQLKDEPYQADAADAFAAMVGLPRTGAAVVAGGPARTSAPARAGQSGGAGQKNGSGSAAGGVA